MQARYIISTDKDVQHEHGISSVQMRMCSTSKAQPSVQMRMCSTSKANISTNAGFLPGFFQGEGGKIYCYAKFYCYANFSVVFGPNFFWGGGKSLRGAPLVEESQNEDVQYKQGISSVQTRTCSTSKTHHQVLDQGSTSKRFF